MWPYIIIEKHIIINECKAFFLKIFMHTLQLLRIQVCIECLIAVQKLKMNNTVVIPTYTQHDFSLMKLCLWIRLQKFIHVNSLSFALNIVIKDLFWGGGGHLLWYSSETSHFSAWKENLSMNMILFSSLKVWGSQTPSLLTFPALFKWWQIEDWDD